jgi:hypothetical protein
VLLAEITVFGCDTGFLDEVYPDDVAGSRAPIAVAALAAVLGAACCRSIAARPYRLST